MNITAKIFHDEDAAREHIEASRWGGPAGFVATPVVPRPHTVIGYFDAPRGGTFTRWGPPPRVAAVVATRPIPYSVIGAPPSSPRIGYWTTFGGPAGFIPPTTFRPQSIQVVLAPHRSSNAGVGEIRWGAANAAVVVVLRLRMLTGMGM